MILLDENTAADYLRANGRVAADERLEVRCLAGGVSNVVLHIRREAARGSDFVLKQARPQLRVPEPWFCSIERIWREVAVLQLCERCLGCAAGPASGTDVQLPRLLFEDRANYAFAMTAAPLGHTTWKQQLLDGRAEPETARACGRLLGRLHAATWNNAEVATLLDDRQFFDDLRLDPYYRHVARVHPDLQGPLAELLDSVWQHRRALVHGDFSPKNLLVWPQALMLIDFEVGHYGDPAFDLGFFLTHLVLKTLRNEQRHAEYLQLATDFWETYRATLEGPIGPTEWQALEARAQFHLAGCLLARVDGKSRVDYPVPAARVRRMARDMLTVPPVTWNETTVRLAASADASEG